MPDTNGMLRVAILQRVIPVYRTRIFRNLTSAENADIRLFIGDSVPNTKVKNAADLSGIRLQLLPTRFFNLGGRMLVWHVGLIRELRKFAPDVILCEGESNFLGYVQAIFYRLFVNPRAALMHWCYISLPGWDRVGGEGLRGGIKAFFRRFFDAFVVYSSFSGRALQQLGIPAERIFAATNVGDTQKFLSQAHAMTQSRGDARREVGLPDRFTALYIGELDRNKRPDLLLDLAKACDLERFNFVLLGSGVMLEELRERCVREGLSNVHLPGRVSEGLATYYHASNAMLMPGRGGIVISEAMAFGVPVLIHQGDGTEYDLVRNGETGYILDESTVEAFRAKLEYLQANLEAWEKMSQAAQQLVETRFNSDNMTRRVLDAIKFAGHVRGEITLATDRDGGSHVAGAGAA